MIKEITLNSQRVPVPFPVKQLDELIQWVCQDLMNKEQNLTRVMLNGEDRTFEVDESPVEPTPLCKKDHVELQFETAKDLVLDSMEAILSFSNVVLDGLKGIAVGLWQYDGKGVPEPVFQLSEDLKTLVEIYEHISEITQITAEEVAAFEGLCRIIRRGTENFSRAIDLKQWENASNTLLNYLEPLVKELIDEAAVLQVRIGLDEDGLIKGFAAE